MLYYFNKVLKQVAMFKEYTPTMLSDKSANY